MRMPWIFRLTVCLAAAGIPTRAQDAGDPFDAKPDCIKVRLVMYSGRPSPRFSICDADRKQEAMSRLSQTDVAENRLESIPPLASTPAYQGMVVSFPDSSGSAIFLGNGFGKSMTHAFRDPGGRLEDFFLAEGEDKPDQARFLSRGKPLRETITRIKAVLRTKQR